MKLSFYKYEGTGNDFVMIDNRNVSFPGTTALIASLCERRTGIGADGLILLQHKPGYDFEMLYYNADGKESSMCGNGGRCIVAFARLLGIIRDKCSFAAVDGEHYATIRENRVSLKMKNVTEVKKLENGYFLDTGSPHVVKFVQNLEQYDVYREGQKIRYSDAYKQKGVNVNFVEIQPNKLMVRTYERGVEDETLSCGTGVTAAVLSAHLQNASGNVGICSVKTKGGDLTVKYEKKDKGFSDIWLEGLARFVFKGEIEI